MPANDLFLPDVRVRRQILEQKIQNLKAEAYNATIEAEMLAVQMIRGPDAEKQRAQIIEDKTETARNARMAARRLIELLAELPDVEVDNGADG